MPSTSIPKIFLAGGAVGFGYYLVMRQHWFPNPAKTPGVQNIENAYSRGGATPTHQPGTATETGNPDNVMPRQTTASGPTSAEFKGKQSDQYSEPGVWPKKFYEAQYGNEKSK